MLLFTLGYAVVWAGYPCFPKQVQLASNDIATIWQQNSTMSELLYNALCLRDQLGYPILNYYRYVA